MSFKLSEVEKVDERILNSKEYCIAIFQDSIFISANQGVITHSLSKSGGNCACLESIIQDMGMMYLETNC